MINTIDTKFEIHLSKKFKKNYKKLLKQGKDMTKLTKVVKTLANGNELDAKYMDHALVNNNHYKNARECHIEPDWLLVYTYIDNKLIIYILETGSHSDLFK